MEWNDLPGLGDCCKNFLNEKKGPDEPGFNLEAWGNFPTEFWRERRKSL